MSRYIDADELKNAFTNWREIVNNPYDFFPSVEECKAVIDAQPTAEVAEKKKCHWIYDGESNTGVYAICSACGESIYQAGEWKYCPNCGARVENE